LKTRPRLGGAEDTFRVPRDSASPDGKLLAAGDYAGTFRLWELKTGRQRFFQNDGRDVYVGFSPDGKTLATITLGFEIHLWNITRLLGKEKEKVNRR
jgi:WD40 repeat protein